MIAVLIKSLSEESDKIVKSDRGPTFKGMAKYGTYGLMKGGCL